MKISNQISSKKGQAMVEFAFVLPLLLLLILAMIEFGRVLNAQMVITQAAREGARVGAVYTTTATTNADIKAAIQTPVQNAAGELAIASLKDFDKTKVAVVVNDSAVIAGEKTVKVTVPYSVQLVAPFIDQIFAESKVNLQGVSEMRKE